MGKSACAIEVAQSLDGEIISADSRQFFRKLSIGTAKPSPDERAAVPHHFVDFLDPDAEYTAGRFEIEALSCIAEIHARQKLPILVGGSGMYIKAVTEGLDPLPTDRDLRLEIEHYYEKYGLEVLGERLRKIDPAKFQNIDQQNYIRLIRAVEIVELTGKTHAQLHSGKPKERPFSPLFIGLDRPRAELYQTIDRRVDQMIDEGLVEEAKSVLSYKNHQALQTVGYKELIPYFDGDYDLPRATELIKRNTRRYAKRQLTWLRKNKAVKWFNYLDYKGIIAYIKAQ